MTATADSDGDASADVEAEGTRGLDRPEADPRRWKALGVLALVQFMLVLDVTVVNVGLPTIKQDLSFSQSGLTWVVDGYTLTAGGLLLLGGRLADLLGRRTMFFVGVGLFAVASAISGAAQNPAMLVASRFLQGAGEAVAAPAAFGLIALLFTDKKERVKAVGIFSGVAGLGGTFGPVVSGLLVSLSWRLIFFINIPVALFAVIAVAYLVNESRAGRSSRTGPPDIAGATSITAGLISIVYGLIQAADHPWGSWNVLVPLLVGIAVVGGFIVIEAKVSYPLVPLGFFTNRTRVTANGATLLFSSAFFTMFFLLTLYWQQVEGWTAIRTGLAYLPFGIGIGVGIALATVMIGRIGVKPVLVAGLGLVAAGMALLSRITVDGSYLTEPLPAIVLMSLGSGFAFASFGNASVHEVSREDASLASGVQNATQQIGGAIGLAALATLALRHSAAQLAHQAGPPTRQAVREATTSGDRLVFGLAAVVLTVGALLVLVLLEQVRPDAAEAVV